ncbi:biotin transporter BioY [Deltaproteobacteria bacterium]|nr:biotin transporter BioY [Deltaproteobacteria bacterium]
MKNQTQILTYPSLFQTLVLDKAENNSQKIFRYGILILAGSALIAICAQVSFPFYPVPVTMQTFAVLLIGLTYGWRLGGITMALYLVEGAIGLPVFAGGKGGMIVLMGPTAGYLYGFFLAAVACGWFAERGFDRSYFRLIVPLLAGNVLLYTSGLIWLGNFIGWDKPILDLGLYPFIPGDLLKIALAAVLLPTVWKSVERIKQ